MRTRTRSMSLLLAASLLAGIGCTSYKPIALDDAINFDKVRIVLDDGTKRDLYGPWIESDTLRGYESKSAKKAVFVVGADTARHESGYLEGLRMIPIEQIDKVQHKSADATGTGLLVAGGILVAGVVALAVACPPENCGWNRNDVD